MEKENVTGKASALLPVGVFLVIFLGAGIALRDFSAMPAIVAFLIALFTAFLQNRKVSFDEKIKIIAGGLGEENIITMCLIFLAAGGFSGAVKICLSGFRPASPSFCRVRPVYHCMLHIGIYGDFHGNDRGFGVDRRRDQ